MATTALSATLERPVPVVPRHPCGCRTCGVSTGSARWPSPAVVIYHLGAPWMRGGFLGVDVFFVLSRLPHHDADPRRGRTHRPLLVPALLRPPRPTAAARARPPPAGHGGRRARPAQRGGRAARGHRRGLGYVSNWWQIAADRSYFELVSRPPLLQHLWSLAIEEQFYLVFPLVALLAIRWGRARVGQLAAVLAVASTVAMAVIAIRTSSPVPHDPSRVYFGTDTHSMGLLVGAAMASVWMPWRTWLRAGSWTQERGHAVRRFEAGVTDVLGVLALLAVLAAFVWVDEYSSALYRGGFLAFSVLAAVLVGAVADPAGVLGRQLGPPAAALGRRAVLRHLPVALARVRAQPPGHRHRGVTVARDARPRSRPCSCWPSSPTGSSRCRSVAVRSSRAFWSVRRSGVGRPAGPPSTVGARRPALVVVAVTVAVALAQVPTATRRRPRLAAGVPDALSLTPSPSPEPLDDQPAEPMAHLFPDAAHAVTVHRHRPRARASRRPTPSAPPLRSATR